MYHYTESGLRNVYLENGYTEIDTPYGKAISISNTDGLHKLIADTLIEQPYLSGREFRFLRIELDMTQREVGDYLGVSAQAVALWEKSPRVQRKVDQMIRAIYQNIPTQQIVNVLDHVAPARFGQYLRISRAANWRLEAQAAA